MRRKHASQVFYATGFIGLFFLVTIVLGAGAITIVGTNPSFFEGGVVGGKLIGGGNMPVMHPAKAVAAISSSASSLRRCFRHHFGRRFWPCAGWCLRFRMTSTRA